MAHLTASNMMTPESSNCSGIISPSANMSPPQPSTLHSRMLSGPVSILWDIENCPVPSDVRPEDVAGNIRMALRVHPVITGAVTLFSAYGDFNAFPRRLREGCQRTGVKLVDVPNGRKDAADKAILVDMFLFALDNPPPSSILLISGDVDFAPALHILGQRGYTVILVIPARVDVSSALTNAGRFVWDWPSVARGEGFVPPKYHIPRSPNLACYFSSSQIGDNTEGQYEESIVYTGISRGEYSARGNLNQMHYNSMSVVKEPSRGLPPMPESGNHPTSVRCAPSKAQSLPCGVVVDRTQVQDQSSWVHPGDIQGLRGQLIKLLEVFGGSLALARVPPEYLRKYGRPLYVAEYGVFKLVNLINKIGSPLSVVGKGQNKMVCLRIVADKQINSCPAFARKNVKGKGGEEDIPVDIGICRNTSNSSDDFSDEEKIQMVGNCGSSGTVDFHSQHLNSFRQELQELLVCYSCHVLFTSFEALYEQRYKKRLNYRSFGVDGLDNLIKKVSDVVELCEEPGTKRKILVSSFASG